MRRIPLLLSALALVSTAALAADAIPRAEAEKTFAEMRAICGRDGRRFWGVTLCGPVLLVEPQSRAAVANGPDAGGALTREGDVYAGLLPPSENISNAPMRWSGTDWTELMWPLHGLEEKDRRRVSLAHEMFHRIQPRLGLTGPDGDNQHLDTLEGRYLLQLEWRALAGALDAPTAAERRRATEDALAFRAQRYRLFPKAADNERMLEYNEGLAEYTGLMIGLQSPDARVRIALDDLKSHVDDETYVRTFAYATGPAYGLLLDRYGPGWRRRLPKKPRLGDLLAAALYWTAPRDLDIAVKIAAARYDDGALRQADVAREAARQQRLAGFRAKFVDGPVLYLPMHHANVSFVPMDLQPLDDRGTVYTKLRVSADWGVLEVANGALLKGDFSGVTVSAAGAGDAPVRGDGWTLTLKPGWRVVGGARPGDFTVKAPG
jgi:hypothetical protein